MTWQDFFGETRIFPGSVRPQKVPIDRVTMMLSTARFAARCHAQQPTMMALGRPMSSIVSRNARIMALRGAQQSAASVSHDARAWQSTEAVAAAAVDSSSPENDPGAPKLVEIPALPFVGSLLPAYSNTPPMDESLVFETWPELRRRFGDFYSIGIPGLGDGWKGTMYVIQDPKEMMKILRREGIYPTSIVQKQWVSLLIERAEFCRVVQS